MTVGVKIRGIYATALTKLLLDSGYRIVDPSPPIQQRFGLESLADLPEINTRSRSGGQGVIISGEADLLAPLVRLLQEILLDAVLLDSSGRFEWEEEMQTPDASAAIKKS
jgi:hypothetical protein